MGTTNNSLDATLLMSVYHGSSVEYLNSALKSVLRQSVPLREYIFVVDGPVKKEILEILDDARSFITDAHVKLIKIKTNTGLANALMYGVNCATSKFIIRMDDDDIALPGRFARLAELIQCYPDADIIGAQIVEFTEKGQFRKREVPLLHPEISKQLAYKDAINHVTVCAKRESILSAGNYSLEQPAGFEDYILWQQMKMNGARFLNDNQVHVLVRFDGKQIISRQGLRYFKNELKVFTWFRTRGMINTAQFIFAVTTRFMFRLVPHTYLASIYTYFLRKHEGDTAFFIKTLRKYGQWK